MAVSTKEINKTSRTTGHVGQDIQEEIILGRESKKCTVPQEEVSWVSREGIDIDLRSEFHGTATFMFLLQPSQDTHL